MAATGPEICARCSCDLSGPPVPHQCPECGLRYDEHTRTWRPARSLDFYLVNSLLAAGVFALALTCLGDFTRTGSWLTGGSSALCTAVFVLNLGRVRESNA